MSKWSEDVARRIREKKEEKQVNLQKAFQEKKTRDDALKHVWGALSVRLHQMCDELAAENVGIILNCQFKGNEIIVTRKDSPSSIRGTHSPITYGIEFAGILPSGLTGARDSG